MMIQLRCAFVVLFIIMSTCVNVGQMGRSVPPNTPILSQNGVMPNVQEISNNFVQQLAVNNHAHNQRQQQQQAATVNNNLERKTRKGFQVGGDNSKVKLNQLKKLRSSKKSKKMMSEKKEKEGGEGMGMVGKIMFLVFMMFSAVMPQEPQNVYIRYNKQFVPIERQFVSCQPVANGGAQKCEFSVDQIVMNHDFPNVSIWANFDNGNDDDGTIKMLGEQNILDCESEDDNSGDQQQQSYCEKTLEIKPDQLAQLPRAPMPVLRTTNSSSQQQNTTTHVLENINRRRKLQDDGLVTFTLVNRCPADLVVSSNQFAQVLLPMPTTWPFSVINTTVSASSAAARLWPELDCGKSDPATGVTKKCLSSAANGPVSLFEWTFDGNGQTYDVSYVDAATVPMSVHVPKCPELNVQFDPSLGHNLDTLIQKVPEQMQMKNAYGVLSVCAAYGTPEACCTLDHRGPTICGPVYSEQDGEQILVTKNGMTDDQIVGLQAMQSVFPTSYNYAFDDIRATKVCQGADHFVIGLCCNCDTNDQGQIACTTP